jgi:hypothetical protein
MKGIYKESCELQAAFHVFLSDCLSERCQCQTSQFHVLLSKGDADNRNCAKQGEDQMRNHQFDSPEEDPEHIHYYRQASGTGRSIPDFLAERHETQNGQLEQLHTERNAHNSTAENQAAYQVPKEDKNASSQEYPKYISQKTHIDLLSSGDFDRSRIVYRQVDIF